MSRPRATLMSHAPGLTIASVVSLIISSVSGVRGAASTMKSDSPSSSGSVSGPPTRSSMAVPNVRSSPAPFPSPAPALASRASCSGRRRTATTRHPNAVARAPTARPMEPRPTIPTVTSRSSAPSRGCHVRSRCSSRSCGSRRLTARIIIRTYSAMGRLNTPRAFVTTSPRSRAAGVSARSTPDVAEWTQDSRGARTNNRSNASEVSHPRSITSTSSSGPSARPSTDTVTIRAPGAAARIRSRSRDRYRADRMGLRAMAVGAPPGPLPGPAPRVAVMRRAPGRSSDRAPRSPHRAVASPVRPTGGSGHHGPGHRRSRARRPPPSCTAPS